MGFYGNLTDRRQVIFQFDKVFNNRKSMDELASTGKDGVFAGRFVLVKYDPEGKFFEGDISVGYLKNDVIYMDADFHHPYIFTTLTKVDNPTVDDANSYYYYNGNYYFKLPNANYFNSDEDNYYIATSPSESAVFINQIVRLFDEQKGFTQTYYKCTGSIDGNSGSQATWELINHENTDSDYLRNYNIDKVAYGSNFDVRGYDATIWEKIYNGKSGKFILIAYLNGVMPGLELYPDPPTIYPNTPYIDALSSDSLYRIHVPSMFGFQLRSIDQNDPNETFISDQSALMVKIEYNNVLKRYERSTETGAAAVYFNKQASDYTIRHRDQVAPNEIKLEPSGESGRVYYDTNGNEITNDLMELSISLPIIGNMVSDGYDMIYGTGNNDTPRLTNTAWISGDASDEEKMYGPGNSKNRDLSSMAGTLNIMHDVLGQIVVELDDKPTPEFVQENLSEDLLYKIDEEYYRVGTAYDIEIIDDETEYFNVETQENERMLSVDPVEDLAAADYIGNKYLVWNEDTRRFVAASGDWDENLAHNGYFLRTITGARYQPIELTQFETSQYYYKDGIDYRRDNSVDFPLFPDREYYELEVSNSSYTFLNEYVAGRFHILNNNNYILSTDPEPQEDTTYYEIKNADLPQTISNMRFYAPGFYYIYDTNSGEYAIANGEFNVNTIYYNIVYDTRLVQGLDANNQPILYHPIAQNGFEILNPQNGDIQEPPSNINNYYYLDGSNFIAWNNLKTVEHVAGQKHPITIPRRYYIITSAAYNAYPDHRLYIRNKYYKQDETTGDYIKATGNRENVRYYDILAEHLVENPFYLINKYYYKVAGTTDQFELATTTRMVIKQQNPLKYITYYTKKQLYVYSDSSGQCPHGYEWNDRAKYIPPSIILYYKTEFIDLIPINGLYNSDGSVFGQALALSKMFGINDSETRDANTMRGAFNILKDLLYTIKNLVPGRLLCVNEFGQIESTDESITVNTIQTH